MPVYLQQQGFLQLQKRETKAGSLTTRAGELRLHGSLLFISRCATTKTIQFTCLIIRICVIQLLV